MDKCFLHQVDLCGRGTDMVLPQPEVAPHNTDATLQDKAFPQQPVAVQLAQSLAVLYVALAAGQVLYIAPVDQVDLDSRLFQNTVQDNPVYNGGFHGDRGCFLGQEVVPKGIAVFGKGGEHPDILFPGIHIEALAADIYTGCMGVDNLKILFHG